MLNYFGVRAQAALAYHYAAAHRPRISHVIAFDMMYLAL